MNSSRKFAPVLRRFAQQLRVGHIDEELPSAPDRRAYQGRRPTVKLRVALFPGFSFHADTRVVTHCETISCDAILVRIDASPVFVELTINSTLSILATS